MKEDIDMELEELLERYEEEIYKWWFKNKNKLKFLWYGYGSVDYKTIRDILNFKPLKLDVKEAFIGICDIRIDSLKLVSTHNLAKTGALIASLALAIATWGYFDITLFSPDWPLLVGYCIFFLVLIVLGSTVLEFIHVSFQIHAWYAIKEGVLLMKDE